MNEDYDVPKDRGKRREYFHVINLNIFVLKKTRNVVLKLTANQTASTECLYRACRGMPK